MILGQEVTVKQDSSLEKECHGESLAEEHEIRLNPCHSKTSKTTLIHEMIHMCLGISGVTEFLDEKQEEAVCRCLENALADYIVFPGAE